MIEIKHRFSGAVLKTVAAEYLRNADLAYADLAYADLAGADLDSANLDSANLAYANLDSANLARANLARANLDSANLAYANLAYANLARANLAGAKLSGANLARANLDSATITGISGYLDLGIDGRGYHFRAVKHADGWRINAGCRWFTVPEAVAHWTDNKDALARVAIVQFGHRGA